jgi:hypothetical protein
MTGPAPELGGDTEWVLRAVLGLSDGEIAALDGRRFSRSA